jgi:hypothetical protein
MSAVRRREGVDQDVAGIAEFLPSRSQVSAFGFIDAVQTNLLPHFLTPSNAVIHSADSNRRETAAMSASVDNSSGPTLAQLGEYAPGKDGRGVELPRVVELFVLLADQLVQIEQTVAEHFPRKLLPGGEQEEQKAISAEMIRQYLGMSDGDPARGKAREEMERRLSGLGYQIWSVMKSMESLPLRYAKTRSPAAIEEAPEITAAGGLFRSDAKFRKYWEKYVQLCGGRDGDTLVKTISDLYSQILVGILQARFGPAGRDAEKPKDRP